jgi:peptide/nickel transport system substrate-binding protein
MNSRVAATLAAAAASVFVLGFAAPSADSRGGAIAPLLVWGVLSQGASTLTPSVPGSDSNTPSLGLEPLMKVEPNGQLRGLLAQSMSHPNPTTYIFHLRHGVNFWDGNEMTAVDVANSINYERYPGNNTSYWFPNVKAITPVNRYTVRVSLKQPDASIPYAMSVTFVSGIFEKKFQDAHKKTMGKPGTLIEGTGPYEFNSYDPTSGAELTANPHYWGGPVPIKHISVKYFADDQSLALAFRSGAIDVAFPADPRSFAATSHAALRSVPGCGPGFLALNTSKPPFSDVHVRRAVADAISRQDIIAGTGGYATPSWTYIAPISLRSVASQAQINALMNSLPNSHYNLAKAKQEMAKSAYPHGATSFMEVYTPPFPQLKDMATVGQVVVAELAKIGLHVKLKPVTTGQMYGPDSHGKIPLTALQFYCQTPDPGLNAKFAFYGKYLHTGSNLAEYNNPVADRLVDQGGAGQTPAARFAAYSKLLRLLASDLPVIGLYASNITVALSNKFSWPTLNAFSSSGSSWILDVKPK